MRKLEGIGETDANGNFLVFNRKLMLDFFEANPSRRIGFEFRLIAEDKSAQMRKYYWVEPVVKMQYALSSRGYMFDKDQTHDFIRGLCPCMRIKMQIEDVEYERIRDISDDDFTNADFCEYLEQLGNIAATEFSVIINPPRGKE